MTQRRTRPSAGSRRDPAGGITAVDLDVPRPDLATGANRIIVVTYSDAVAAAASERAAVIATGRRGGSAELVGTTVVTRFYDGDDAVLAAARSCARAES